MTTPESPAINTCTNCGITRSGNFCAACGQRHRDGRLALRMLGGQLADVLFDFESGLWLTLREMLIDPGGMIRQYIEGKRRRYLNPFTYLMICSAVGLATYKLAAWVVGDLYGDFIVVGDEGLPPQAAEFLSDLISGMIDSSALMAVFQAVPFGLLLRAFFGRRFTIAENLVFSLYTLGQTTLIGSLAYLPLLFIDPATYGWGLSSAVTLGLATLVCLQAGLGFFGKRLGAAIKLFLAMALSYSLVIVLTMIVVSAMLIMNPQMREGRVENTLYAAVAAGEIEAVEEQLANGAEVDQPRSETALHLAAALGHAEIIDLLIEQGAALDARDHLGRTPLHRAVEQRRRRAAVKLIELGADPMLTNSKGQTVYDLTTNQKVHQILGPRADSKIP